MKKNVYLVCLSVSVSLCSMAHGQTFNMVLRIDNIQGESTLSGHTGELNVLSYSDGISSCAPNSTSKTTCKAVPSTLNLMTLFDKATIPLKLAAATAKVISSADLTFVRGGTSPLEFYKIHLENIVVTAVQESGSQGGDTRPAVSVSLAYSKIAWQYTIQSTSGGADEKVTGGWDFSAGKAFTYAFQ